MREIDKTAREKLLNDTMDLAKHIIPIAISIAALLISYTSYQATLTLNQPLVSIRYATVKHDEFGNIPDSLSLAMQDSNDILYIEPLLSTLGENTAVALTSAITKTDVNNAYANLEYLLIENVSDKFIGGVEIAAIESVYTVRGSRTGVLSTSVVSISASEITLPAIKGNQILALPLKYSSLRRDPGSTEPIGGTKIEIDVKSIKYYNSDLSASFTIIPRPALETPVIVRGHKFLPLTGKL